MKLFAQALVCAALLATCQNPAAHAQSWPNRPIRLIVPTGPGLGTDIMARLVASGVSQAMGQQIYVENISGAAGILGAQAAARPPRTRPTRSAASSAAAAPSTSAR